MRKAPRGRSQSPRRAGLQGCSSPKNLRRRGSPAAPSRSAAAAAPGARAGREGGSGGRKEGGPGGGSARPRRLLIDSQLSAPPLHKLSRPCAWLRARTRESAALPAFLPPPPRPGPGPGPASVRSRSRHPRPAQPLRSTEQVSARREETPNPPSSSSFSSSGASFLPARSPPPAPSPGGGGAAGSLQSRPLPRCLSSLPPGAPLPLPRYVCVGGYSRGVPRLSPTPPPSGPQTLAPSGLRCPPPAPPLGTPGCGASRGAWRARAIGLQRGLVYGIAHTSGACRARAPSVT